MADNTESTTEPDSDGDNLADYLELDSDDDGCNDVVEAGYTDDNGDGILGAALPTFNANGTVSSGVDGYTTPADIDGNTVADYTESGPNNASSETQTACTSYDWNGTTYTTSGTYTFTSPNIAGCDSIATLNLTINAPSTGDTTAIACDSLEWYGTWYNATGAYTDTLTAANGCDSVVTLNLTITPTEDATFSYDTTNYCTIGTDPTPTVTGTSGGTFSSESGLAIDASTGAIDLSASTAGTYTVEYITSSNQC